MKQVSLFDSFLKKQKPMEAPPVSTNQKPAEKERKEEFKTAEKIDDLPKDHLPSSAIQVFKTDSFEFT